MVIRILSDSSCGPRQVGRSLKPPSSELLTVANNRLELAQKVSRAPVRRLSGSLDGFAPEWTPTYLDKAQERAQVIAIVCEAPHEHESPLSC